jgi:hypothetical protein
MYVELGGPQRRILSCLFTLSLFWDCSLARVAEAAEAANPSAWINEIGLQGRDGIIVEVIRRPDTDCSAFEIGILDSAGDVLGSGWDPDSCESENAGGAEYNDFIFSEWGMGLDKRVPAAVYLSYDGQCLDIFSWNEGQYATTGPCAGLTIENAGAFKLNQSTSLSRHGYGDAKADFASWQQVEPSWGYVNFRQIIEWTPAQPAHTNGNLDLAMLELPKPRNSIVKGLQDAGFVAPPKNQNVLKVHSVSELSPEVLTDDGDSTYMFFSNTHRQDLIDYLKQVMTIYVSVLGSVRAENYFYDWDSKETSEVLAEVGSRRGRLEAKGWFDGGKQGDLPFVGTGGGYSGMNEREYVENHSILYSHPQRFNLPKKNFDVSGKASEYQGNIALPGLDPWGSYTSWHSRREGAVFSLLHEYGHNWEAQHTIVDAIYASWSDTPREGTMGPELVHQLTGLLPEYFLEYAVPDSVGKHFSLSIELKNEYVQYIQNKNAAGHDWVADFASAEKNLDQYFELNQENNFPQVFFAYLIRKYGLNKFFVEFYRRVAVSADWRLAIQQTIGRSADQLFEEVAHDFRNKVRTASDLYLIEAFQTPEEFVSSLGMSYNVSFLQARSDTSPNQEYRTLYTYVGKSTDPVEGAQFQSVAFADSLSLVLSEGVDLQATSSESGQLQINGHNAYFYAGDTSAFHAGGLAESADWAAFTRYGDRTSDLFFPVYIYDHDKDGLPDDYDKDFLDRDADGIIDSRDDDDDNDGVTDDLDAFAYDPNESVDTDWDGIGDNADIFNDSNGDGVRDKDLLPKI